MDEIKDYYDTSEHREIRSDLVFTVDLVGDIDSAIESFKYDYG